MNKYNIITNNYYSMSIMNVYNEYSALFFYYHNYHNTHTYIPTHIMNNEKL